MSQWNDYVDNKGRFKLGETQHDCKLKTDNNRYFYRINDSQHNFSGVDKH